MGCKIDSAFHVSQLKKHLGPKAVPNATLPLLNPDGTMLTEPEELLDRKLIPRIRGNISIPVVLSLIKWKNMSADMAAWEDSTFTQKIFPAFHPLDKSDLATRALSGPNLKNETLVHIQLTVALYCFAGDSETAVHRQSNGPRYLPLCAKKSS